ncbi:MAG: hypothetical protein GKS00_10725 [Alphaproteobacteria bacterium]|nr:hypothetical protein [Alphaproteobacteria bacterium]
MTAIRFLVGLAFLASAGAAFGEDVAIRGWSHLKFGRLVFDWPTAVEYSASIDKRRLTVRFNKTISARFEAALQNLGDYVSNASISRDGRIARFDLAGDFSLRDFRNENAIVLDLRRAQKKPASKVTPLSIRVGEHPAYTRLVFDWNRAVEYNAALRDGRLQVRFDKPAIINLPVLRDQLPENVKNPQASSRDDGFDFGLGVEQGARLRHFRSGTKVVVDILVKSESAKKPEAEKPAPPPEPIAKNAVPAVPEPSTVSQDELLEAARKAVADAKKQVASAGPRRLIPEPQTEEAKPKPDPEANELSEAPVESSKSAAKDEQPSAEVPPLEPKRGGIIAQAVRESNAAESEGAKPPLVSLVFEWPEAVGAAVFERAGFVWIIFDKRAPIELAALREAGKGLVSRLEQLPIGNATVLRMVPGPGIGPFARRDGTNWVVDFRRGKIRPDIQIGIDADPDAEGGARLFFPAIDVGSVIRMPVRRSET